MDKFKVIGGKRLEGEVEVFGGHTQYRVIQITWQSEKDGISCLSLHGQQF